MYRERLTITLDKELLAAIDSLIDKEQLRNRSQTIEHLLKEGIGLHGLQTAFIFLDENFDQASYQSYLTLCATAPLTRIFLGLSASLKSQEAELIQLARTAFPKADSIETAPTDFGTGGALMLKKDLLSGSFLVVWPQAATPLPTSLAAAYAFHRAHHGLATHLLQTHLPQAEYCGVTILESEVLSRIPAGVANLQDSVFPDLAKEAKVKGYLYQA